MVLLHLFFTVLLASNFPFFTKGDLLESSAALTPISEKRIDDKLDADAELEEVAFQILKTKCNVCHRKRNRFKIFSRKNRNKHALKIYKQVFVYRRMPKGNKIKLTEEEYQTLKNWLKQLDGII